MRPHRRKVLKELLRVGTRNWRAEDDEHEMLMEMVEDVDVLTFDQYHWADYDDELGFGRQHLRDLVNVESEFWPVWQNVKQKTPLSIYIIQIIPLVLDLWLDIFSSCTK